MKDELKKSVINSLISYNKVLFNKVMKLKAENQRITNEAELYREKYENLILRIELLYKQLDESRDF